MAELHLEAANFAQSIINLQENVKALTAENQQLKSDRAMDKATIDSLRSQNATLTSKMEYYQRRTAELDNTVSNVGALILKCLDEGKTAEYRDNGSAKVDEKKLEQDITMPSVVTKGPKVEDNWK